MQIAQTMKRHPRGTVLVAVVIAALGAFALYWFAPWNLFVDRTVDEALPGASAPVGDAGTQEEGGAAEEPVGVDAGEGGGGGDQQGGPVTLTSGGFTGLEHETAGTALILELEDGSRFLRLEDLETSNGPDLRVILTDQPLSEDWDVWDDGAYVDLGALKGNLGSSNYEIPRNVDLKDFVTAVIWCRRFSVGFGVAPLAAA
jgi:hypothetical protein